MRILIYFTFTTLFFSCQVNKNEESTDLYYNYVRSKLLNVISSKSSIELVTKDNYGNAIKPEMCHSITKLRPTDKFNETLFIVQISNRGGWNIITSSNKAVFEKSKAAIIQASPGFVIVTPVNGENSYVADYYGEKVERVEKSMIDAVIVSRYRAINDSLYVIGTDGKSNNRMGLLSKDFEFIIPLYSWQVEIQRNGVMLYNNSGDGGTLYDHSMNEIWTSSSAIPDYVFDTTFVYSNQSNFTSGILNMNGDTLFSANFMIFNDRDIHRNIIVYRRHLDNLNGAVNSVGEEIIPVGDHLIFWEGSGMRYLTVYEKNSYKILKKYDSILSIFIDE